MINASVSYVCERPAEDSVAASLRTNSRRDTFTGFVFVLLLAIIAMGVSTSHASAQNLFSYFSKLTATVSLNSSPAFSQSVDTLFSFRPFGCGPEQDCVQIYGPRFDPCKTDATTLLAPVLPGLQISESYDWRWGGSEGCGPDFFVGPSPIQIRLIEKMTVGEPVRRRTRANEEYEAVPMKHERDSVPWVTYFYGYRIGPSESVGDWSATSLQTRPALRQWPTYGYPTAEKDFKIVSLPPPIIEGTVTEYVNSADYPTHPGGIYFYASTDEDRRILDAQLPGKFVRTGKSFKHGGYVSVCRFYGSPSPGPNTHFYTANFDECELIKSLEVKPRPLDRQQLNYEGKVFYANLPIPSAVPGGQASCPAASVPLYRAYNAAFGPQGKRNYDSNHRFSTNRADIDEVVQKGWVDEGMVMCVPQ